MDVPADSKMTEKEKLLYVRMGWSHANYLMIRDLIRNAYPDDKPEPKSEPGQVGLQITSDGTPTRTLVTFDGKPLKGVRSVVWRCYHDEMAQVEIEMVGAPVTVNAVTPPEVQLVCSLCGNGVEHKCGDDD